MNIFTKIIQYYKEKFIIPHSDAAGLAEMNRVHTMIVSFILFLFGIGDVLAILLTHLSNIGENIKPLIYFSIYTIVSLAVYIYSLKIKDCPKEKAYLWKNIKT